MERVNWRGVADRHANLLIFLRGAGSNLGAYSRRFAVTAGEACQVAYSNSVRHVDPKTKAPNSIA
jgi:hypothetical protein